MYCRKCGSLMPDDAAFCQKCGAGVAGTAPPSAQSVPPAPQPPAYYNAAYYPPRGGKDKTTAVLLAVFLGYWTWVYTYKKDALKFWLCLGWVLLDVVLFFVLPAILLTFCWFISIGIRIWAIVQSAVRSDEWYRQYPDNQTL